MISITNFYFASDRAAVLRSIESLRTDAPKQPKEQVPAPSPIVYTPKMVEGLVKQAASQAREDFARAIKNERPDTMQATEEEGDIDAWNGKTIDRVLKSLRTEAHK